MNRVKKALEIIEKKGLDALIVTEPFNVSYYTGIRAIADSLLLLVVEKGGSATLYTYLLEYYRMREEARGIDVVALTKRIKPSDAVYREAGISDVLAELADKYSRVGADVSMSPIASTITEKLSGKTVDVTNDIWAQRMVKEDWEIQRISRAIEATGKGILTTAYMLTENTSEAEAAGWFEARVRREGVEEMAFPPLILFKPGNSYPHNLPGRTVLGEHNLVLMDVGVYIDGYCSDITRMVTWGRPDEEEKAALETLVEAIDNVMDNAEPGMKASEIDVLARSILEKRGYGERFIHGLGHGLGLYVHESPRISPSSDTVIEPGMVFTVEPGIYVPGRYGVRIEEDVVMTEKGLRVLSSRIPRIIEL